MNRNTPEEDIAGEIDRAKASKTGRDFLLKLLDKSQEIYAGRASYQVDRIRGYAIASFEVVGLSELALPHVLEELDNGHSPYLIAASAKALRGWRSKDIFPSNFLIKALTNIGHKDDCTSFESYWPNAKPSGVTTATREILLTLQWMGGRAKDSLVFLKRFRNGEIYSISSENRQLVQETIDKIYHSNSFTGSCCQVVSSKQLPKYLTIKSLMEIKLQDQEGDILRFKDFFAGHLTVVVFFYTRCDNPNRCSLTISKLAQIQTSLSNKGLSRVRLAAITYDPSYDINTRLKEYTLNRGLIHNDNCKVLRTLEHRQNQIADFFNLQVNYRDTVVNHHSIELFIINSNGYVIQSFTQFEINSEDVVNAIEKCHLNFSNRSNYISHFANGAISYLMLLFPKCPLCWATYMSALGLSGVSWLNYDPNLIWVLSAFAAINMALIFFRLRSQKSYALFFILLASYLLLIGSIVFGLPVMWRYIASGLIAIFTFWYILAVQTVWLEEQWDKLKLRLLNYRT